MMSTPVQATADMQSSSTPPSSTPNRLKSHSYKALSHTRLRSQCSPYSLVDYQNHHSNNSHGHHRQNIYLLSMSTNPVDSSSETDESCSVNQHLHPTTPASSSLNESSLQMSSTGDPSPSHSSSSLNKNNLRSLTKTTSSQCESDIEPLYVTPVTCSDNSSPQPSIILSSIDRCSGEVLTRSTSLGSLASEEMQSIKSTYSSHESSNLKTGFVTPSYSELPDSPGETSAPVFPQIEHPISDQFYVPYQTVTFYNKKEGCENGFYLVHNQMFIESSMEKSGLVNGREGNNRKLVPPHEEVSVLTVDSNPKSNDITVIERTMLNGNIHPISSNEVTCSGGERKIHTQSSARPPPFSVGSGSSAYVSGSSSYLANNLTSASSSIFQASASAQISPWPNKKIEDNEYFQSISLNNYGPNTSQLPTSTPDLAFVRNLLSTQTKTTPISDTTNFIKANVKHFDETSPRSWKIYPNFTPPVKLENSNYNVGNQINRALFMDWTPIRTNLNESEMLTHYNEGEEDPVDCESILSLPSLVKAETESLKKRSIKFDNLLSKALTDGTRSQIDRMNMLEATSDSDLPSFSSPCFAHHMVSLNNSQSHSDEDEDEKIILEFIDENFKAKSENKENDISSSLDAENSSNSSNELLDLDSHVVIPDLQPFVNPLKQEAEYVAARILPKIDEESEDEKFNLSGVAMKKPFTNRRLSTNSAKGNNGLAKVVLTKTARLRMAQKFKVNEKEEGAKKSDFRRPNMKTVSKPCLKSASLQPTCNRTPAFLTKLGHRVEKSSSPSVLTPMNLHSSHFNKN